ncbi:MAG: hypothetical protein NZ902_03695 [Acidilobaceae archaeon]|nr:hypothetical protein [Acidilobaceae archaeon]MCX8165167.1 hypothetical protein [Acidilobaceae archaeon]MDW7974317.1 hypothetical protein [Sulfolobales archaeon]
MRVLLVPLGYISDLDELEALAERLGIEAEVSIWPVSIDRSSTFDVGRMKFIAKKVNEALRREFAEFLERGGLVVAVSRAEGDVPFLVEDGVVSIYRNALEGPGELERLRLSLLTPTRG